MFLDLIFSDLVCVGGFFNFFFIDGGLLIIIFKFNGVQGDFMLFFGCWQNRGLNFDWFFIIVF